MHLSYPSMAHYFNPETAWSKHYSCWQPDPNNWHCLDRNESGGTRTRRSSCGICCGTQPCQAAACWEELCGVSCPCRWRNKAGVHFYFVFTWSISSSFITVVLRTHPTPVTMAHSFRAFEVYFAVLVGQWSETGFGMQQFCHLEVSGDTSWPCRLCVGDCRAAAEVCLWVCVLVYMLVPPLEAGMNLLLATQGGLLCVCVSLFLYPPDNWIWWKCRRCFEDPAPPDSPGWEHLRVCCSKPSWGGHRPCQAHCPPR